MNKIVWVNFFHIYQPPWQQRGVIEQIAIESYDYLITLFEKYPQFKASVNITGSLLEALDDIRPDLLARLQKIAKKGQIELTGSSKYHALLPLLSDTEVKRQIELNQEVLGQYFDLDKIKGFYMPEMAFSLPVAKIVKKMGFEWIILDQINYQGKVENDVLYKIKKLGIKVVFRDRKISKSYPAEIIFNKFKTKHKEEIIITGTDGEIYGHFHEDWQGHLESILQNKLLQVMMVSKYFKILKKSKNIDLRAASWESNEIELKNKKPYSLWNDPKNEIHKLLWQMVNYATKMVNKYKKDKNWQWSRNHLDRGVSSCTFWWATGKRLSAFSPLTWNPDMIDNGSEELIKAVRSLESASIQEKIKAEKLYIDIKKNTWLTHWRKYNK